MTDRVIKILSIDFDFFVKADMETRQFKFPDGREVMGDLIDTITWNGYYPQIEEVGVKEKELKQMIDFCKKTRVAFWRNASGFDFLDANIQSHQSHKMLYDLIMGSKIKNCEVYNIDFHHDMYVVPQTKEEVDCGNWGTVLYEKLPNFKMIWVRDEESDTIDITGETVKCEKIMLFDEFIKTVDPKPFDIIFMCRSNMWSPPHLDKYYRKLEKQVLGKSVLPLRKYQAIPEIEALQQIIKENNNEN